jgi:hypothetical protein
MAKGLAGYGRYDDDHIGCPRAATDMTPCVARDGIDATDVDGLCVGCGEHPVTLLTELVRMVSRVTPDYLKSPGPRGFEKVWPLSE